MPKNNTGSFDPNHDKRRLWGRAHGRPLSPYQLGLIETKLPELDILGAQAGGKFIDEKCVLEIGFGGAEHLLHCAQTNPDNIYLGAEPFLNGVAKALAGIDRQGLENVYIHHGDVWAIMDQLPKASLSMIYILYPDPWPKPRHYKRRLIQHDLIDKAHELLVDGGELRFASDIVSYVDWALLRILNYRAENGGQFNWPADTSKDWLQPYADWPSTRYEAKALREGRTPHYFTFVKS